jgi:hypothetical protein
MLASEVSMKTKDIMSTVNKEQAIKFVLSMRTKNLMDFRLFNKNVQEALFESTGQEIIVTSNLAQGLSTAMTRKARMDF